MKLFNKKESLTAEKARIATDKAWRDVQDELAYIEEAILQQADSGQWILYWDEFVSNAAANSLKERGFKVEYKELNAKTYTRIEW